MKSAKFCREALEDWKKVSDENSVRQWHRRYTPQILYNETVLDTLVNNYKERLALIYSLKAKFMKMLKLSEEKAWNLLKELKTELLSVEHTADMKERYKRFKFPELTNEIFENFWTKLCSDREDYLAEANRQLEEKKREWYTVVETKYKFIEAKELENILLTILY